MAEAKTVYVASDGSRWDHPGLAEERDRIDALVRAIESTIPSPPREPTVRIALDRAAFIAAKTAVIELCRELYPTEPVFQNDPMAIHPMSFAGRFLDDNPSPVGRIWHRFACSADGFMYEQPYYALNPDQFKGETR